MMFAWWTMALIPVTGSAHSRSRNKQLQWLIYASKNQLVEKPDRLLYLSYVPHTSRVADAAIRARGEIAAAFLINLIDYLIRQQLWTHRMPGRLG